MAKITRYTGNLPSFGSNSTGTNRTVFGDTSQSDALDDNINADYLTGWEIVGPSENPTLEDFNALGFTHGQLLAYLHQAGVAEYDAAQEYFTGSTCNYQGNIYKSLTNSNIGNTPSALSTNWSLMSGAITATDYNSVRNTTSASLVDGQKIFVDGYADPWEVKTGTVSDDGWHLVFADDTNRYAQSTSPVIFFDIFDGTDDTDQFQKAISYAQSLQSSLVVPDNSLTVFSLPRVVVRSSSLTITSSITSDAAPSLSHIEIVGNNTILNTSDGVVLFGGVSSSVKLMGFIFVGGDAQVSVKTNNLDASNITIEDCQFQAPKIRAIQIDATSNSTFLKVKRCKFTSEYSTDASTDIIYAETGDFVSFEDCWFSWNSTADAAMYLSSAGNQFNNCVFIPTGGTISRWMDWNQGTLAIRDCTFGSEAGVTDCFVRAYAPPVVSGPINATRLSLENNTINVAGNPPLIRFFRIPNMVNIEKIGGASIATTPMVVDSSVPASDLNAIGNKDLMLFTVDGNIADLNGYIDYDLADVKANVGIPLQRKELRKVNQPLPDVSDVQIQTAFTGGFGLFNGNTATLTTPTDEYGVQIFRLTATADGQLINNGFNTMLNGLPAGVYTACFSLTLSGTTTSANVQVKSSRSTESYVLTTGHHILNLPFYFDGTTAEESVSVVAEMENGLVIDWNRVVIFSGVTEMNTRNLKLQGIAAPGAIPGGSWFQGDIVENKAPIAAGTLLWAATTAGATATWTGLTLS